MSLQPLRGYQERAYQEARRAYLEGARGIVLVAPTGAGKTRIGVEFVQGAVRRGNHVVWIAHRTELIQQAHGRLRDEGFDPLDVDIIAPWAKRWPAARVHVASTQTLAAALRRGEAPPHATVVVFDEAHHYAAADWSQLSIAYGGATRIGLTATPERGDGCALGGEGLFDALIPVASVRELIAAGVLVHSSVFAPEAPAQQLAEYPAVAYLQHGRGRRGFVFVRTVRHAQQVADALTAADHPAAVIHGDTPGPLRVAMLESFRSGSAEPLLTVDGDRQALIERGEDVRVLKALVSCETLTEGVDVPAAEVCILACKIKHAGAYIQRVGRVLRASPGKDRAVIVDLFGNVMRHGLPDADREYSLEGRAIELRGKKTKPEPTSCPDCGAVFEKWRITGDNRRMCPHCGKIGDVLPDEAEVARKALLEAGAFATPAQRADRLERLIRDAIRMSRQPGWAYHRYFDLFGVNMSRADWALVKARVPKQARAS